MVHLYIGTRKESEVKNEQDVVEVTGVNGLTITLSNGKEYIIVENAGGGNLAISRYDQNPVARTTTIPSMIYVQ